MDWMKILHAILYKGELKEETRVFLFCMVLSTMSRSIVLYDEDVYDD